MLTASLILSSFSSRRSEGRHLLTVPWTSPAVGALPRAQLGCCFLSPPPVREQGSKQVSHLSGGREPR